MRKIIYLGACCLALTGCTFSPGLYVKTDNLRPANVKVKPLAKPTLIPINSYVTHHKSKYSSCSSANGTWICANKNDYQYHIGPGDILTVIVYDHPELTNPEGEYRSPEETGIPVSADGTINYPFVGRVEVSGLTTDQVATILTKRLAKYIQSPQLNVRVSQFNAQSIQVLGEVSTEKTLPITNVPLNLLEAINSAGGFNLETANTKFIYVIRGPDNKPTVYWLNASEPDALLLAEKFYLKDHDIVYVSTAGIARWQRFVTNLVPTVEGVNTASETANR